MTSDTPQPLILVVEDDDLMRELVVEMIAGFGYGVATAANAVEAMHIIEDIPAIALVFTDIAMPGLDGIMLADMIKQHRPKLKILYTTGGTGLSLVKSQAGILHGDILKKPYHPNELETAIGNLLAGARPA